MIAWQCVLAKQNIYLLTYSSYMLLLPLWKTNSRKSFKICTGKTMMMMVKLVFTTVFPDLLPHFLKIYQASSYAQGNKLWEAFTHFINIFFIWGHYFLNLHVSLCYNNTFPIRVKSVWFFPKISRIFCVNCKKKIIPSKPITKTTEKLFLSVFFCGHTTSER